MNIEYITCSGISFNNDIEDIIDLGKKYLLAEFAVQASPKSFYKGSPKYEWFNTLLSSCKVNNIRIATHVNLGYCKDMCHGVVPCDLQDLWNVKRKNGEPVIGRVQININGGNDDFEFHADKVADIIREYSDIKFIFQYAPAQRERIEQLAEQRVPFSLLYDVSGGEGKLYRDSWGGIILPNHQTGYAGGLSPDNIAENLDYINKLLPPDCSTWIDAEGRLKSVSPDGKKVFDTRLAEKYIERAIAWQMKYGYQK